MKTAVISLLGLAAAINGQYTKSIIYETEVNTITSCGDYVTNCAYGHESTTVHTKTTDYEHTTSAAGAYPTVTPKASVSTKYEASTSSMTSVVVPYTTSTVRITKEYTITSCAPTVTNCPVGAVTTTVIESTTVCPVAEATSKPYSPPVYVSSSMPYSPPVYVTTKAAMSSYAAVSSQAPVWTSPAGPVLSTLTISTCVPTVITSVITVTGAPTTKSPYTPAKPSTYPVVPPKNNGTIEYTGSASTQRAGGLLFAALGLAAALL